MPICHHIIIGCDRRLLMRLGTTFIVTLFLLGHWGCASTAPMQVDARPLQFTPQSGSVAGNDLVFIEVEEPAAAAGTAAVQCRFGPHAASPGVYDAKSGRYLCSTPAHPRPESVNLAITLNGVEYPMPAGYAYSIQANSGSPVFGIDLPSIRQQASRVRQLIPPGVAFAAVLKNGEPVGLLGEAVAQAGEVDYFCVPNIQDGIALRQAGVTAPIMVLYLVDPSYAPVLLHYGLEPAASSREWVDQANRLLQRAQGVLPVHLWIDTGLGREGVMPAEALALARAVDQSPKLRLQGIATHFCCNDPDDLEAIRKGDLGNQTALQKSRFDQAIAAIHAEGIGLDAIIHAGASEVLRDGTTPVYYDMLRIGTLLFENPAAEHRNYTWTTRILQVKTLPAGWCIDYGCDSILEVDTPVGLVAHIPYDDVDYRVRGTKVKVLLDHEDVIVLDLSQLPGAVVGEVVEIILPDPKSPLDVPSSVPVSLLPKAADH